MIPYLSIIYYSFSSYHPFPQEILYFFKLYIQGRFDITFIFLYNKYKLYAVKEPYFYPQKKNQ